MEQITLRPVDGVHITTLVDNCSDLLLPDEGLVRRWGIVGTAGEFPVVPCGVAESGSTVDVLRAEHGFSSLVEIHDAGTAHRVLFDAGVTPEGLVANLDRLGIDPATFEAVVLSHGHFDHVMGLEGLARRVGVRRLPLVLHPDFWSQRRVASPAGTFDLPTVGRAGLAAAGFEVVEGAAPSFLLDGALLVTGEVDRTTDFETGFPVHQALRGGEWLPDPLIRDDQAVLVHVRDKGLVVLTGCGHSGIVNIVRHARRLTGIDRVYAVLGGFHLSGGFFERLIPVTVSALAAFAPKIVVPAHCTGWKAQMALAEGLGDAFSPNSVGSRFTL